MFIVVVLSVTNDINAAGYTAIFVRTDVTKAADWHAAVNHAISHFGKIDVLVNNAGWTYRLKESLSVTETEYDRERIPDLALVKFMLERLLTISKSRHLRY